MQSNSNSLNKQDLKRIGLHLLIVGAAAILTEALNQLGGLHLGASAALYVPVVSFVIKTALTYLQGK